MDLSLTSSELKFRDELRAWLKSNAPTKANLSVSTTESAARLPPAPQRLQTQTF